MENRQSINEGWVINVLESKLYFFNRFSNNRWDQQETWPLPFIQHVTMILDIIYAGPLCWDSIVYDPAYVILRSVA